MGISSLIKIGFFLMDINHSHIKIKRQNSLENLIYGLFCGKNCTSSICCSNQRFQATNYVRTGHSKGSMILSRNKVTYR